jgi:hypothetical protein
VLEDFLKIVPQLEEGFMSHFANPFANEACKCGSGDLRLVHCQECFQSSPACRRCFMLSHRQIRWHWAWIWDIKKGMYSSVDYSDVLPESADAVIQLGHSQDDKPCSLNEEPQAIIVVHSNGVHNTKIRFCFCSDTDRAVQLTRAGLFPGSPTYPQTAFTFAVLKQFQYHTRQSRCSSFDWIVALRRMTDDVSLHRVSVRSDNSLPSRTLLIRFRILTNRFYELLGYGRTSPQELLPDSLRVLTHSYRTDPRILSCSTALHVPSRE